MDVGALSVAQASAQVISHPIRKVSRERRLRGQACGLLNRWFDFFATPRS